MKERKTHRFCLKEYEDDHSNEYDNFFSILSSNDMLKQQSEAMKQRRKAMLEKRNLKDN